MNCENYILGRQKNKIMMKILTDAYYITKKNKYNYLSDSEFSLCIMECLENKTPFFAGRIGATECSVLRTIDFNYVKKQEKMLHQLSAWSGFFPEDKGLLPRFAQTYEKAIGNCDVLYPMGYRGENYLISRYATDNVKYYHTFFLTSGEDIWLRHLRGRKVLVIHPFAQTIQKQYDQNRTKLHKSPDVLPEFELHTLKAVFTAAGEVDDRFSDWFEALEYMYQESKKIDYDIALVGCGAYGFPLASMIKDDGKVAVHFGGELQLLFGIKGARWELPVFRELNLYNEFWTYADHTERPKNFASIEGSSYWETVEEKREGKE